MNELAKELKILKENMKVVNSSFEKVKNMLNQKLKSISEKDITRISDNVFTIKFSALDCSNLCPQHYDVSYQVNEILKVLNKAETIFQLKRNLENFIETKKISNKNQNITINSVIINILKDIEEDLSILEEEKNE